MANDTSPTRRHVGARVRFAAAQARLLPPTPVPKGFLPGRFSVLSPGTEQRHLAAAATGPAREAGYMTLGGDESEGWVLAPVPHGAAFDRRHEGAVTAPAGTPVHLAALARFQQMAVLGLDRLPVSADLDGAVVVGSGPVALGCVLELHRRGAAQVRVLTSRRLAPIGRAPGVKCVVEVDAASAGLVVDAAGTPGRAAALLACGGVLGLLGTPDEDGILPALTVHRGGWTVVGMHELTALAPGRHQAAYATAAAWLTERVDLELAASWCRTVPGELAPEIFALLGRPGRPDEPVIIFSWVS